MKNYQWPRLAPDSLAASVLLALLATAGLFYVNIMPALVEALTTGLHFSQKHAGWVGSANVYGAAVGALVASMLITRIRWRAVSYALLLCLICIDMVSITIKTPDVMIAVRAFHGFIGGTLVGIAFSVIARTTKPERTFGMLLLVQYGLGGLGVMFIPQWVPHFGIVVLFVSLIAFSATTLILTPFLDDYASRPSTKASANHRTQWSLLLPSMLAVFLFQFANMLPFAYIIGLAKYSSLNGDRAAEIVGASNWIGIAGSILVIVFASRFGMIKSLLAGLALTIVGVALLHASTSWLWFAAANCISAITWSYVIPYLLALCAKVDATGRAAALGGFASKLGLATGPLIGGMLAENGQFESMINISISGIVLCAVIAMVPARMVDQH